MADVMTKPPNLLNNENIFWGKDRHPLYETPSKRLQLLEFHFSLWLVVTAMYVICDIKSTASFIWSPKYFTAFGKKPLQMGNNLRTCKVLLKDASKFSISLGIQIILLNSTRHLKGKQALSVQVIENLRMPKIVEVFLKRFPSNEELFWESINPRMKYAHIFVKNQEKYRKWGGEFFVVAGGYSHLCLYEKAASKATSAEPPPRGAV